jgi:outer membrane protein assembly factor BamA
MAIRIFIFFGLFVLACSGTSFSQRTVDSAQGESGDLIDIFYNITHWDNKSKNRDSRKIHFSLIPVPSSSVAGSEFLVSSINGAFYLGSPLSTNLSTVYFIPYTNFISRLGFIITPNVWLSENKWNMTGDLRIIGFDLNTYGIGAGTSTLSQNQINYDYVRVYLNANRQVSGSFYMGLGYNLDDFYNVTEKWPHPYPSDFDIYGIGTGKKTTSSGISFNLLWDNRKNSINPAEGFYSTLVFRVNPSWMGSDYQWTSLYFDNRRYFSFSDTRHEVLAIRAFYWGTYGDVPYLNLASTSLEPGARSGRGYVFARYIGKQMLYSEAEYRFDLAPNGLLGGVVFANAESFSEMATNRFAYLLPAIGTGIRVKFNRKSGTNVDFDFAAGKNSLNWYINLGEYF